MDFCKFINSKDIALHLRELDYQFTSIEAAWLVWQSKYTSLNEKHKAWKAIIANMPDCEILSRLNTAYQPSLHAFLKELMELQNRTVETLKEVESSAVYMKAWGIPGEDDLTEYSDKVNSSFPLAYENAINACNDNILMYSGSDFHRELGLYEIVIKKYWCDSKRLPIEIVFNGKGEVYTISNYGDLTEHENDLIYYGFDGMCFAFPVPFKKGDVVVEGNRFDELFVFDELGVHGERKERLLRNGDSTDMTAYGYFKNNEDGKVFYECMHSYMDLEYYRGKLSGGRRIYKAISNYLRGTISLDLLINAYKYMDAEEHTKELFPTYYNDEGLRLAGLMEDDK